MLCTSQTITRSPDKATSPILQLEPWVSGGIVIRNPKNLSRCEAKCNSGLTKPTILFQETRLSPFACSALQVRSREHIDIGFQFWYGREREPQTPVKIYLLAHGLLVHYCFVRHVAQIWSWTLAWFAAKYYSVQDARSIFRKFTMRRQIVIFARIHSAPEFP